MSRPFLVLLAVAAVTVPAVLACQSETTGPVGFKKVGKNLLPLCAAGLVVEGAVCCPCEGDTVKVPTTLQPTHVAGKCQAATQACGTNRIITVGPMGVGNVCAECGDGQVANADNTECVLCPSGAVKVSEGDDDATCVACGEGSVGDFARTECVACPAGTTWTALTELGEGEAQCACNADVAAYTAEVCAFEASTGVQLSCVACP